MEYFVGVGVSLLVEYIKRRLGTNTELTLFTVFALSLVAGAAYNWLVTGYPQGMEAFTRIIISAGAFHNFIIKRF